MTKPRQSAINASLRSSSRPLVPTAYAPTLPRHTGRYDSSERLPDLEHLFDRTVNQIRHVHDTRQHGSKDFEERWSQVCKDLSKRGNASAYARWKHERVLVTLTKRRAEAWAKLELVDQLSSVEYHVSTGHEELQAEKDKHTTLWADAPLEVAIAYWIEARNAYNQGDEPRAFHALVECHFYFGVANSPRTESESKSTIGKNARKKERDAIAQVVVEVMRGINVDRTIRNQDELRWRIVDAIVSNAAHVEVLAAHDKKAVAGKQVINSTRDRFFETLRKWIVNNDQPYPEITKLFNRLSQQLSK
ncbi:hypothetical protein ACVWWQ_003066 [Rhodanobacter sp. TND4EL1]